MTILNKENSSMYYPKNLFPTHIAFLSDSLFGGNLKPQLTSYYFCKTMKAQQVQQCTPTLQ